MEKSLVRCLQRATSDDQKRMIAFYALERIFGKEEMVKIIREPSARKYMSIKDYLLYIFSNNIEDIAIDIIVDADYFFDNRIPKDSSIGKIVYSQD